jgi:hypothetical protein
VAIFFHQCVADTWKRHDLSFQASVSVTVLCCACCTTWRRQGNLAPLIRCPWYRGAHQCALVIAMS